jgi:hypothetical protein
MDSKFNIKSVGIMLFLAIILLSTAFFTITSSFALDSNVSFDNFDIRISNIQSNNMNLDDISVRKNNLLFNIHLNNDNQVNSFIFDINNNGNVDGIIRALNKTKLDKDILFNYNNRDYYLSDFIFYNVTYSSNNADNSIVVNSDVLTNDIIKSNTSNSVLVNVRLKRDSELDDELKSALDYYLSTNSIDLTLSLDVSFNSL